MSSRYMNRVLFVLPVLLAPFCAVGCNSPNRQLDVRIELLSDDPTLSIEEIEFVAVGRSVGSPVSHRTDKFITCTKLIQWREKNILILTLTRDGDPYRNEIYELDQLVLKKTDFETEWLSPDYASIGHYLAWDLLDNSGTSTKLGKETGFLTRVKFKVKE